MTAAQMEYAELVRRALPNGSVESARADELWRGMTDLERAEVDRALYAGPRRRVQ